jgi:hypothetical protein
MVTTRPIEITLVREQSGMWAEFENKVKIFDMKVVQERLLEENKDTPFSTEPIKYHSVILLSHYIAISLYCYLILESITNTNYSI